MTRARSWLVGCGWLTLVLSSTAASAEGPRQLATGWTIQSSARVQEKGDVLSRPGFRAEGWHAVNVPNTVVGALVESGHFPDPYFGMNLRTIPGTTYPIGERFTLLPTPPDSPFKPSWWYRIELTLPASARGRALGFTSTGSTTERTYGSTERWWRGPTRWWEPSGDSSST